MPETKKTKEKYGLLPEKGTETDPWEVLCINLIGPFNIQLPNGQKLQLWFITMIDPDTRWFEMAGINQKDAYMVADIVQCTWFTRYPWPTTVTIDSGTELLAKFVQMI